MQEEESMRYRDVFCHEYLDKIFYFCLRKTGNESEALDLSSDISLQIMQALHNHQLPEHFSAWVWQIARNRYAKWAEQKHKRTTSEYSADMTAFNDIMSEERAVLDEVIVQQDIKLLRQQLAFIRSDYREILVAYYIHGRKIKDIASEYKLPENTVKTKLYNSRVKLREGMSMAREFGKLSYDPEHIQFGYSVYATGENGEPFNLINRKIPKNILIETYRNPSTAEQLSLELGIAFPYMEDEIELLLHSTLLRKNGNRYEYDGVMLSKETQTKIHARFLKKKSDYARAIREVVEMKKRYFEQKGVEWARSNQTEAEQRWSLIVYEYERVMMKLFTLRHGNGGVTDYDHLDQFLTTRPHGGIWDVVATEAGCELAPIDSWMGNNAIDEGGTTFVFNIDLEGYRPDAEELNVLEEEALSQVIVGRAAECEHSLLLRLENLGYIRHVAANPEPCCLDIKEALWLDEAEQSEQVIEAYDQAINLLGTYYDECMHIIKAATSRQRDHHAAFCAQLLTLSQRAVIVEQLLADEYLQFSNNKMVGVFHVVK